MHKAAQPSCNRLTSHIGVLPLSVSDCKLSHIVPPYRSSDKHFLGFNIMNNLPSPHMIQWSFSVYNTPFATGRKDAYLNTSESIDSVILNTLVQAGQI